MEFSSSKLELRFRSGTGGIAGEFESGLDQECGIKNLFLGGDNRRPRDLNIGTALTEEFFTATGEIV